jgi:two-component system response regulator (stage 0 sporulation protein F)
MGSLKKILVADDEAGIRALLFDVLSSEGFNVTLAKDGRESLRQMRKGHFDLLITDINMPGLDGIQLLKAMKREGRSERVIIMTGNSEDEEALGGDIPPVYRFLHKPVPVHSIVDVVTSALKEPSSGGGKVDGNQMKKRAKRENHAL